MVDIAFIIDSSGSISRRNWERVKRFVKAATSKLDVSSSGARIAAIAYSTDPEVVMRFNDYQGTDEVNLGFDGMRHQRGYTYTDKALELADRDVFQISNGMRFNVPKVSKNYISSLETGITLSLIDSKIILPKSYLPPPRGGGYSGYQVTRMMKVVVIKTPNYLRHFKSEVSPGSFS